MVEDNRVTEVVCGQASKPGKQDGVVSSAMLQSPCGIATMGSSLFICDTGNWSIRLVSSAVPLKRLSSVIYPYAELFNLDYYRGPTRKTFQEALDVVDTVVEFFMTWAEKTRRRTGRVSTQGTDQIIPYCTRRSFVLMHESLVRLTNILTELSADSFLPEVRLTSMVTDSYGREFLFANETSCVRELVKRMYRGQVSYFTGPKNYYPDKVIDACTPTNIEEV